ncbi:hypothetical protein BDV93DRAFT_603814 [Ceratobasidium sp. AG-I]|nr:hypothetical protein BDV93DRAFT_603814 [Ceratobasidium sp. AG-I]
MARFVDVEAQKLSEPGPSVHWGRALADPDASDKGLEGGWMVTTDHFRPSLESLDPGYFSSPLNKLSLSHVTKKGLRLSTLSTFRYLRPSSTPPYSPSPQEKELKANKYQRCACMSNGWSTRPLTSCGPYPPEVPAPTPRVF